MLTEAEGGFVRPPGASRSIARAGPDTRATVGGLSLFPGQ